MSEEIEAVEGGEEIGVEGGEEARPKLTLEVKISSPSACERKIAVTVPPEDIKRYRDETFSEIREGAAVPGFRHGRAPRKLVEHRFRKELEGRVKGGLLMDAMSQVTEDFDLAAISEPDIALDAIVLPEDGPLTFEFSLEVRPEFDVPEWRGLRIERPVREIAEREVDARLKEILERLGRLVPSNEPAGLGDYIVCSLTFQHGERRLSRSDHEILRIRPRLSFRDAVIEQFDQLMVGVKSGDVKTASVTVSDAVSNEALRGKPIEAVFEIQEVKRLDAPELTDEVAQRIGCDDVADLRQSVRLELQRRFEYEQDQQVRRTITQELLAGATWELPQHMLIRQAQRELDRAVLEMKRAGFSDNDVRARENALRRESMAATARALKEHFILEKIAETEKIEDLAEDYEEEVRLIARQSGESSRRVRAQLEKKGLMDALRNQIIERKVLDLIRAAAVFVDVPMDAPQASDTEASAQSVSGASSEIPEAKHPEGPKEELPPAERD